MLCDCLPEVGELLHEDVIGSEALLEISVGMHVEDDSETVVENHLYCRVEVAKILCGKLVGLVSAPHRLRIHAKTHVVEAHGLNQCNIFGGSPGIEMLFGVAALVPNLSEPIAEVDATSKVLSTSKCEVGSDRLGTAETYDNKKNKQDSAHMNVLGRHW